MSWTKFLPLRFIIRHAARKQGFLDPLELLARLRSLAQPSEVGEPIELLRAGMVFHARGLINSKVIQNNLDWVWPYWVERQYNPRDPSFIPRAFSVSHINLSHRNWTAIGHPDCEEFPLVDPRGLLTPFYDGWSLDGWIIGDGGRALLPSQCRSAHQQMTLQGTPAITTTTAGDGLQLTSESRVELVDSVPVCILKLTAQADAPASLVLTLRPQNPEGVSFVHTVSLAQDDRSWQVDGQRRVAFSEPAREHRVSDYSAGDVFIDFAQRSQSRSGHCEVGLLTAAASFPIDAAGQAVIEVSIPLAKHKMPPLQSAAWTTQRENTCRLECPEQRFVDLYDAAVTSLILHSPQDVYPGPYTYKRFWFRDAAFMLHAMLCTGLTERAERALCRFPERQTALGFFRSQEGEWDSNGEVLWILQRFAQLTGRMPQGDWHTAIEKGARWIIHKRLDERPATPHAGLLPAGFSAEHLGPNDYYYWDNFWSVAGLRAAAGLLSAREPETAASFAVAADDLMTAVERSLHSCQQRLGRPGMPASPYRRLDAGAVGSLAVAYPLQLWDAGDPRVDDCVEFLLAQCFVDDAFFQDMIHSGLNAYLTLHVAQVLLRKGDPRYLRLLDRVAQLATSTGQWPEAIHPQTLGGCMGDGHHVWAAAEWVLMLRNAFLREEGDRLILCAGVPARWLATGSTVRLGPAPSDFGLVDVALAPEVDGVVEVSWQAQWRTAPSQIEVRLPSFEAVTVDPQAGSAVLRRSEGSAKQR